MYVLLDSRMNRPALGFLQFWEKFRIRPFYGLGGGGGLRLDEERSRAINRNILF